MAIYLRFSSTTRSFGRGKGKVYRMSHGQTSITPRNLNLSLFQIASEFSSAGQPIGRRRHDPIVIVKEVDSASPLLWQALCTNEVLQSADLSFVRPTGTGGKEVVVERVTLTNAVISKVQRYTPKLQGNRSQHDTNELEEVELTFTKIDVGNVLGKKSASDDWSATK
jgi:type VI secretion system secreted protein Hcp